MRTGASPAPVEVAAGILWRQGEFLAVRRPPGADMAGFWEFPGGKLEKGESPEQALARELAEELAVTCEEAAFRKSLRHEYPERVVLLHFFDVRRFRGLPSPREGQELRWVLPEAALAMNFLPADISLVRELAFPRKAG